MAYPHICHQCGNPFSNRKATAQYCSRQCNADAKRMPPRTCRLCGSLFHPRKDTCVYCSQTCYRQSRRGRHTTGRPKTTLTVPCLACGKEFLTTPGARRRGHGLYCGPKCRYDDMSRRAAQKRTKRICEECGKEYEVATFRLATTRYCSRQCHFAHRRASIVPGQHRVEHMRLMCETCGKSYELPPSLVKGGKHYCSQECHYQGKRTRITFTCERCGKPFERQMAEAATARFCSRHCSHLEHSETSIEKTVRQALTTLGISFEQEYHLGRYVLDFYLPDRKIAIEADGTYWHKGHEDRDSRRDARLSEQGITTIRLPQKTIQASDPVALTYAHLSAIIPMPDHVQLYLMGPQST